MWQLFAQVVDSAAKHASEVATSAEGTNSAMGWPLAVVLMVLTGVVGLVGLASVRAKHSFRRDVTSDSSVTSDTKVK